MERVAQRQSWAFVVAVASTGAAIIVAMAGKLLWAMAAAIIAAGSSDRSGNDESAERLCVR